MLEAYSRVSIVTIVKSVLASSGGFVLYAQFMHIKQSTPILFIPLHMRNHTKDRLLFS